MKYFELREITFELSSFIEKWQGRLLELKYSSSNLQSRLPRTKKSNPKPQKLQDKSYKIKGSILTVASKGSM